MKTELIQNYIIDCINTESAKTEPTTLKSKLQYVVNTCISEKRYNYAIPFENVFKDWVNGACSTFEVDMFCDKQSELLKQWNVENDKNDTHKTFLNVIYRVFSSICKANNISVNFNI